MLRLNRVARDLGAEAGVTAATDVTGFGLLGHLGHMVEASKLRATLSLRAISFFVPAIDLARRGVVPGGTKKNLAYVASVVAFDGGIDEASRLLLADAQTSGGLLLAVPEERAASLVARLVETGHDARDIGLLEPPQEGAAIRVEP